MKYAHTYKCTTTGPLELVLSEPGLVSFFVPHAADVGMLRRIKLGPGVTVKVAGLKSIVLRCGKGKGEFGWM
jgi:hypothetical protein